MRTIFVGHTLAVDSVTPTVFVVHLVVVIILYVQFFLGHIVAVDSVTPTVFCISEAGDLVHWFDCSDCMREPSDIAVYGKEYFVCDFKVSTILLNTDCVLNHRFSNHLITCN